MRTRILYLIAGVLLAAAVFVGTGLLRAQVPTPMTGPITITSDMLLPKWEYAWVEFTGSGMLPPQVDATHSMNYFTVNGAPYEFRGTVPEFSNHFGADGWELVYRDGIYIVFKRPLP